MAVTYRLRGSIFLATLLCTAVAGCQKEPAPPGAGPVQETQRPSAARQGAEKGRPQPQAVFVHGGERDALVSYLQTVREVVPRKFSVDWNPDVVKIDRETAIATLQSVSADGVEFRFKAGAAAVRQLTAGRILFLWGIALRRITSAAEVQGDWVVQTEPVSLPEVFRNADIDFDYQLDASQGFATLHQPATPAQSKPAARLMPDAAPRALPVLFFNDARAESTAPAGPRIIDLPTSYFTTVNGIEIELAYQPTDGGLHFEIEARKEQSDAKAETESNPRGDIEKFDKQKRQQDVQNIRDAQPKSDLQKRGEADAKSRDAAKDWQKAAAAGPNAPNAALTKALFGLGSDLLDLRLRASGDLDGIASGNSLSVSNQLQIRGSALGLLKTEFRNVNGKLKLQFIARRGEKSEQWIEKLRVDIPVRFNIPVIVAGLPMIFQVGFDVIAQPALTTKNDTFDASYEIPFSGSGNVSLEGDKFSVGGTLAASPNPLKTLAASIGVSAILVALQAPRVGLGVGLFGASTVVYIDLVSSATITSGGSLGLAPCRQYQLVTSVNAGVDTKIAFDLPGLARFLNGPLNEQLKKAGQAASLRQPIFKKEWYRVDPDIPVCRVKSG